MLELPSKSLGAVVKAIVSDQYARVEGRHATPITSGTSRASVWRVHATVDSAAETQDVTAIYKTLENVAKDGTVQSVDSPRWKREALLYESGLPDRCRTNLRSPRCYRVDRISPTKIGLWLEDIGNLWSEGWSLDRYHLAARHLGQFNASYIVDATVPNDSFLGRDLWRETVEACARPIELLQTYRDQAAVKQVYEQQTASKLISLWQQRDQLITQAHQISPLTLCHGDTSGRNLFESPSEPNTTVAIDWYYVGLEPLGLDAARLLGSSLHWFFIGRMDLAEHLEEAIADGYLLGLRDAGWNGDLASVRDVYRIAAATIYGLSYPGIIGQILRSEVEEYGRRNYGCSADAVLQHRMEMGRFFSGLTEDAAD